MSSAAVTTKLVDEIVDAFNRKDVDAILGYFDEDGVFQTSRGTAPSGQRIVGRAAIGDYLRARYREFPDWCWHPIRCWTAGDRAVAEWKVVGTDAAGKRFEWMGCDLLTFRNGKLLLKDTFWKCG